MFSAGAIASGYPWYCLTDQSCIGVDEGSAAAGRGAAFTIAPVAVDTRRPPAGLTAASLSSVLC